MGPGPYAQVDIHLIDSTHATALFSGLNSFSSSAKMGLDINATHFGISGLSFILAPGVTKTPSYTVVMGGKVGSVGNFALDYTDNSQRRVGRGQQRQLHDPQHQRHLGERERGAEQCGA